jgi:amidase
MTDDLSRMDATDQAALVRSNQASPLELVDAAIAAIEKLNPELNAVIHPLFDRARAEAAGPLPDGPFKGVPFLLKDLGAVLDGTPFSEGSAFAGDYVTRGGDQELTARFRAAGFVICGKTNTPEFGILPTTEPHRFGATRNPWDPTRTTGGSSGGSAAAVASGMVPVAHANDGGGSIRIPASACGLVGLKPTRGRVSLAPRYGDVTSGLVCEHVVSRSVRDSAAILDATSGPVPGDPYAAVAPRFGTFAEAAFRPPERLRIALMVDSPVGSVVHLDCVAAARSAAALCESLGHEVVEPKLAVDGDQLLEHFINVWSAGTAWTMLDWEERIGRLATPDDVEALTWAMVSMGRALDAGHYLKSVEELQKMGRQMAAFFDDNGVDLLLTPTLGQPPVPLGSFEPTPENPLNGLFVAGDFVPFTPVFNATGQPAISVPLSNNPDGLPIGVQFVARTGDEETLLSVAGQLEQAAPWADRVPRIHA